MFRQCNIPSAASSPRPSAAIGGRGESVCTQSAVSRSWTVVGGAVAGRFGRLRTRKGDLIVGRDRRIVRAGWPLEDVASAISNHRAGTRLAAPATSVRVKQQGRVSTVSEILRLHRMRIVPQPCFCLHCRTFGSSVSLPVGWDFVHPDTACSATPCPPSTARGICRRCWARGFCR